MGLFSNQKPVAAQPATPKQILEEELRVAYGHRDRLQKVNLRVEGNLATYILAYWTVKDRIAELERRYSQLGDEK